MRSSGKLTAACVVVVLAAAVTSAVIALRDGDGDDADARPFRPEPDASPLGFRPGPYRYPVARLKGSQLLYSRPDGRPKLRISDLTEWDTPRVLSVVKHRGDWLGVLVPELKNGQVAWIPAHRVRRLGVVTWSLHADLSERTLVVRRSGAVVRRLRVGIGRPGHETPKGRFAVTDRLRVTDPASPYGCCVLALTGHQAKLPPGWPGGDRLAVHATADLSNLGREVSAGCMRADPRQAKWLIKKVPLGSPVFIRG